MLLYPQLPHHLASHIAAELRARSVSEASERASGEHYSSIYTPTGGSRIDKVRLLELRGLLLKQALATGYPDPPDSSRRLRFDQLAAFVLHTRMSIAPAEAAKGGVWQFMCCVLAPDLVRWRFGGDSEGSSLDRYLAGRRNTFQRLWWRAELLREPSSSENPYALLGLLGEDEVVQLMERPNLAGMRELTREIGRGLQVAAKTHKGIPRRTLIREAQKHFMRLSSFIAFEALDKRLLETAVAEVFEKVAAANGV